MDRLDPGVKTFVTSFCSVLMKIIVIISAAGVLGIPMASFVAILGSAGVAIGLALQGSLSNIAGRLDYPFVQAVQCRGFYLVRRCFRKR